MRRPVFLADGRVRPEVLQQVGLHPQPDHARGQRGRDRQGARQHRPRPPLEPAELDLEPPAEAPIEPEPVAPPPPKPVRLRDRLARTSEALVGRLEAILGGRKVDTDLLDAYLNDVAPAVRAA